MRLSDDKISHLSHLFKDTIIKENAGTISDINRFLGASKRVLTEFCKIEDEVDAFVRKKLTSYSKNIMEGSREWDVLYQKHFQEEFKKRW